MVLTLYHALSLKYYFYYMWWFFCVSLRVKRSSLNISQTRSLLTSLWSFSLWRIAKEKTASTPDASVSSRWNLNSASIDTTNIFSFSETTYEGQPRSFPAVTHCSLSDSWHLICVKHTPGFCPPLLKKRVLVPPQPANLDANPFD